MYRGRNKQPLWERPTNAWAVPMEGDYRPSPAKKRKATADDYLPFYRIKKAKERKTWNGISKETL